MNLTLNETHISIWYDFGDPFLVDKMHVAVRTSLDIVAWDTLYDDLFSQLNWLIFEGLSEPIADSVR